MSKMVDFTAMPVKRKAYAGANGSKISVVYQGEQYMLKFPPLPSKNKDMSYTNSCVSEYLGCQIFELLGIPVQKTMLGTYTVNEKEKIVVACKDFTSMGIVLQDFASLKNQNITSERGGYGTELSDIEMTIQVQNAVDPKQLEQRFWDMFIVDALIGNWDRHNGNWGFLYDVQNDSMVPAPVYDCGSSLFPQADDDLMEQILKDKNEINFRVFEIPTSAICENGKRINYFKFISSLKNASCNAALKRIVPRISMERICKLINETPSITEIQKTFYITMLQQRKERILDYSLQQLRKKELGIVNVEPREKKKQKNRDGRDCR